MSDLDVCLDEKIAILNVLREALIDDLHANHSGTLGMTCMATHCWWPYINRKKLVRSTECKPCTAINKNLKSVIPAKQFHPQIPCVEPTQEIQIDFGGRFYDEKAIK